jgi:nicotinate-nucleotide adenylyltransferase
MTRIGVLGGTFDPPHYGHLILGEQARDQLSLKRVLWAPAADPPHKQTQRISAISHRLQMLALALADNPAFEISKVDVERPGPHYTVDMLDLLRARHPAAELVFLIGGDSLRDILTWHDPEGIVARARMGVMGRPGTDYDLDALTEAIPGLEKRLSFIETPLIQISGYDIRRRVAERKTIRYLLPFKVHSYIYEHGLYRV